MDAVWAERDRAVAKMIRRKNVANWAATAGELIEALDRILVEEGANS